MMPSIFFFFNDTATTEIYTLSLHDALPIYSVQGARRRHLVRQALPRPENFLGRGLRHVRAQCGAHAATAAEEVFWRSEEHTSELQSPDHLVCRLLLEKKKKIRNSIYRNTAC